MKWCSEAFKHILFGEHSIGRMEFLKFLQIVKQLFGYGIYYLFGHLDGGDKGGLHAKCRDIFFVSSSGIKLDGNYSLCVIRIFIE